MSVTFSFSGTSVAEFQEILGANVETMLAGATDAAIELAEMGAEEARRRVPVKTGDLRASIKFRKLEATERFKIIAVWGTSKEYAEYVEFGTGPVGRDVPVPGKYPGEVSYTHDWEHGMVAQPYMYPSSEYVATNIEEVLKRCIQRRMPGGGT